MKRRFPCPFFRNGNLIAGNHYAPEQLAPWAIRRERLQNCQWLSLA